MEKEKKKLIVTRLRASVVVYTGASFPGHCQHRPDRVLLFTERVDPQPYVHNDDEDEEGKRESTHRHLVSLSHQGGGGCSLFFFLT